LWKGWILASTKTAPLPIGVFQMDPEQNGHRIGSRRGGGGGAPEAATMHAAISSQHKGGAMVVLVQ